MKIKSCLEQKWRKQYGKNQFLSQTNAGRKRQSCQTDSGYDKADAVRQAKAARQHRNDCCEEK